MFSDIDPLLATGAVVLGLSMVVQGAQQILKQWFDVKSVYMECQLLAMFNESRALRDVVFRGAGRVSSLAVQADERAKAIVRVVSARFRSFGYRNLDFLCTMNAEEFMRVISDIDWEQATGSGAFSIMFEDLKKEVDARFEIAKRGFQNLYERRMKVFSFYISAVIVILTNANVLLVYQQFAAHKPLREAAIAWSQAVGARHASAPGATDTIQPAGIDRVEASFRAQADSIQAILASEGFQVLGWRGDTFRSPGTEGWILSWVGNVLGIVASILLVSLGAPFWYDVLKAVMGVKQFLRGRSAQT